MSSTLHHEPVCSGRAYPFAVFVLVSVLCFRTESFNRRLGLPFVAVRARPIIGPEAFGSVSILFPSRGRGLGSGLEPGRVFSSAPYGDPSACSVLFGPCTAQQYIRM